MESNEIKLEIATLRSALLEVTHRFEKLHTAIDNYVCPTCREAHNNAFPNIVPKRIFTVGSKSILLTPSQSTLVAELLNRPGATVTYDRIIYVMWESGVPHAYDHEGDLDNPKAVLSAHLCHLRHKIKRAGLLCSIKTQWGSGLSIHSEETMAMR